MKKLTVCFSLLLIFLAYATYNFINILDLFKTVDPTLLQEDNCQIIPGYIGIEDFVEYSDEILIGGSNNNLKLFTLNNYNDTENGNMISFNISSKQFSIVPLKNFPGNIAFHPHGIFLFKKEIIYVINHAFDKGGERIEKFRIIEKEDKITYLTYMQSFILPDTLKGTLNDLVALREDEFYFTSSYYTQLDTKNNDVGTVNKIASLISIALNTKLTYAYYYYEQKTVQLSNAKGLLLNGIPLNDRFNTLYICDSLGKTVSIYSINKENHQIIKLIKTLDIGYGCDNLSFDSKTNQVYVTLMGRAKDFLELSSNYKSTRKLEVKEMYGGIITISKLNIFSLSLIFKNKMMSVSNSIIKNNKLAILSSCVDNGIMICEIGKQK